MNFEKAHENLMKGAKIRRKEWEPLMYLHYQKDHVRAYKGDYTSFYTDADIMISNDWKVVNGDGRLLTFVEVLEELKSKKWITRHKWEEEGRSRYIFVDKDQLATCEPVEFEFMPIYKDLCANDWEIMK